MKVCQNSVEILSEEIISWSISLALFHLKIYKPHLYYKTPFPLEHAPQILQTKYIPLVNGASVLE